MFTYLVSSLLTIINFFERHHFGGEKVSKFSQVDPIPEPFFQLCCGGQLFIQTCFHPPEKIGQKPIREGFPGESKSNLAYKSFADPLYYTRTVGNEKCCGNTIDIKVNNKIKGISQ